MTAFAFISIGKRESMVGTTKTTIGCHVEGSTSKFFFSKISKCFIKSYKTNIVNLNLSCDQIIVSVH